MNHDRFAGLGEVLTVVAPDGATATVARHGGHVVSWRTPDGVERLFCSSRATTADGAAIRGGIPVCFPQFAGQGPLKKHGYARTAEWRVAGPAAMALDVAAGDWPGWPHACTLTLEVLLGPATLTTLLRVANTGTDTVTFTVALHTYLACADVTAVSVTGLEGRAVLGGGRVDGPIRFPDPASDVDLAVLDATRAVAVEGPDGSSTIAQTGFRDVVVWNVGSTLARDMSDLGEGECQRYVCVEAAAIGAPVAVAPGASWVGSQTISVA